MKDKVRIPVLGEWVNPCIPSIQTPYEPIKSQPNLYKSVLTITQDNTGNEKRNNN